MRVAIIGLLPAQAQLIREEFRGLDLRIAHKDTKESAMAAEAIAAKADRVLVMKRFVGHSHVSTLDKRKLTMVDGGLTSLRKVLRNLDATAHAVASFPIPVKPRHAVAEPHMAEKLDMKVLRTAKPGDVLEFKRPAHTTIALFEKNVSSMLSYYKRRHGIQTAVEMKSGIAHVMVESIEAPKPEPAKTPEATPPAAVELVVPVTTSSALLHSERQFWQAVFLDRLHATGSVFNATQDANASLAQLRDAFREKK